MRLDVVSKMEGKDIECRGREWSKVFCGRRPCLLIREDLFTFEGVGTKTQNDKGDTFNGQKRRKDFRRLQCTEKVTD